MTNPIPTQDEQRAAWDRIERRLAALDWEPPLTPALLDRLVAQLPTRAADEPLVDWLGRAFPPAAAPADARIIPMQRRPRARPRLLGRALAWAAADAPLEVPALPTHLVLDPGGLRVDFREADGVIHLTLQALGFTLARLRGLEVALTGPDGVSQPLALVTLDARGAGHCAVPDSPETRRLLLRLQVWELSQP